MSTDIDFNEALSRLTARVTVVDDAPPVDTAAQERADRLARRAKAMAGKGWERRPLDLVTGRAERAYDETRAGVDKYLAALRAIDNDEGGIALLAGEKGCGKTAAAARWCYTRRPEAARFLRAAEFFRSSRYSRGDKDAGEAPPIARDQLLREPALVLDDLGAEFADAAGSYRVDFDELLDRFYADKRILVITTNIAYASARQRDQARQADPSVAADAPTFADRYGERVADRLRECGRWVASSAPSLRGRP